MNARRNRDIAALSALGLSAAMLIAVCGCSSSTSSSGSGGSLSAETAPLAEYAIVNGERAPVPAIEMGDPATIRAILDEGMHNNQVMDHLTHIATEIGPRLTGSSNAERANKWARDQFASWGLTNAHIEQWGTIGLRFDRLPSTGKVMVDRGRTDDEGSPVVDELRDVSFTWLAWSRGTDGPVRGPVVVMPTTVDEYEAVKDQLPGAWVLVAPDYSGRRGIRGVSAQMRERLQRFAELRSPAPVEDEPVEAVAAVVEVPATGPGGPWTGTIDGAGIPGGAPLNITLEPQADNVVTGRVEIPGFSEGPIAGGTLDPSSNTIAFSWTHSMGTTRYELTLGADKTLSGTATSESGTVYTVKASRPAAQTAAAPAETVDTDAVTRLVLAAGPAGFISSSKDERVWTASAANWRELSHSAVAPDVEVNVSEPDYDFIMARLAEGLPIQAEFDLACAFTDGPIPVYNTIAEIRGTERPDEIIVVSAHLDSWNGPGSMGTTDNGTGSSVTLEAARILAAAGARPKRTIRFILWTGEEQGLLGSRAYVEKHADELDNISAVFVDDGGTNYEGGLQCVAPMADYLAAATAPVNGKFYSEVDGKSLDVNIRVNERMPRGGGSDHASFNARGVPGFFWDEVGRADYGHGWHTQFDRIDLAIPEYLRQSSTCAAITAYNLACAPDLLPRATTADEPAQERPRRDPRADAGR